MDNSVGTTIEKIKLQEQDKEAKLKEKRELEATISSLNRSIRDTVSQIEKHQEEIQELIKGNDGLRAQLEVERIRRNAVAAQVEACNKELDILKLQSDKGISQVWELRSSLCTAIQNTADECDVWALLAKPIYTEPLHRIMMNPSEINEEELYEERLKLATERRDKAVAERDRLLAEPEVGEEFIRSCIRQQRSGRCFSSKIEPELAENEPIKFSTSPAARRTIKPITARYNKSDMPWYQPYSVLASVTVFLVYFCVLREESDVDLEFNRTLYERMKGLEKQQLLQSYIYNKENGLSVKEIEERLQEIEVAESKALV